MIPEITTFTLRAAFKIPGISAHKAPAIPAPKIAKIHTKLTSEAFQSVHQVTFILCYTVL